MDFYCGRQKRQTNISKANVCAWRSSADTKRGYVQGVNARTPNACGHRLSRFVTNEDIRDASSHCKGNVNWLNHKGAEFDAVRVNNIHQIKRAGFMAGTQKSPNIDIPRLGELLTKRRGVGDYTITRQNFNAPRVMPRDPVDFDGIRAINIAQFGQKVQLSSKTLAELISMNVADPTDRSWIAEFNRRKLAGESKIGRAHV